MTRMESFAATLLAGLVISALAIGGWKLHWWTAEHAVNNQYKVNTGSQQYQAGLVSQERDLVQGYRVATDPGQKAQISAQFCQVYLDLDPAPADLQMAHDTTFHCN